MRKFLKLSVAVLAGWPLIYWAIVVTFLGRVPSTKEFFWPSENSSLNASLAHWDGTLSEHIILGSSAALKNISGEALSNSTEEWKVIGGFGLDPNQSLALIEELKIRNSEILLPISVIGISKINNGSQRKLNLKTWRITTLHSFHHIDKLLHLDPSENSHLRFDKYGNCLVEEKYVTLSDLKDDKLQTTFEIDTLGFRAFIQSCEQRATESNNHIHIITTPFCKALGEINLDQRDLVCQIQHSTTNCTLTHHICDKTDPKDFIDAYHHNKSGARKFALTLKKELQIHRTNALQQP